MVSICLCTCMLTTAVGHANFFSAQRWDHPALYRIRDEHDGQRVSEEAARQNLVFSINHPSNGLSRVWELGYDFDFQGTGFTLRVNVNSILAGFPCCEFFPHHHCPRS